MMNVEPLCRKVINEPLLLLLLLLLLLPYDKSIKLGTLILDIAWNIFKISAIGICALSVRKGW